MENQYFVIHSTAGRLSKAATDARLIKKGVTSKGLGHSYIFDDGEVKKYWDYDNGEVYATKTERYSTSKAKNLDKLGFEYSGESLKGKMVHVELVYADGGAPNESQYNALAYEYIEAVIARGEVLSIVPHIEVDRGIVNGHKDAENFDYNHFYEILDSVIKEKIFHLSNAGVILTSIDGVNKFDHDRYWKKDGTTIGPEADDLHSFPPVLTGPILNKPIPKKQCFPASTLISLSNNAQKPIEDISYRR